MFLETHMPGPLRPFLDAEGRITQWPTRLRRVLYDWRYLERESDCSRYWVSEGAAERIAAALAGSTPG
jgi:hypothetical protein